jgi:hypothetical protein
MKIFLNISNHPSSQWSLEQKNAALKIIGEGQIMDLPFPNVSPEATEEDISAMADTLIKKIREINPEAMMLQGEFTLSFAILEKLNKEIDCYAATTQRNVITEGDVKKVVFSFVKFRKYT